MIQTIDFITVLLLLLLKPYTQIFIYFSECLTDSNDTLKLCQLIFILLGEPDLNIPNEKEYYQMFLRPCKYYPESAFRLVSQNISCMEILLSTLLINLTLK